jgi:hypothetical protein
MLTKIGHLTYCSNIHAGENWNDHFAKLQENIPVIKQKLSPDQPFGIGLRLSAIASAELQQEKTLQDFRNWLNSNQCYVFTMNGFPYGGFHFTKVKDQVHAPDWTSADRVHYTIRLARILSILLPGGMEGGISTSPLSYRFWHKKEALHAVFETSTLNLLQVVEQLIEIKTNTGKLIHIDIEPEPDGLLGESNEFLEWYTQYLLPIGIPYLKDKFDYSEQQAEEVIKQHIQLCYDVCHFAVCYEDHAIAIERIKSLGIRTGKIQISAALKAGMPSEMQQRKKVSEAFSRFNEPVYLHQVVAMQKNGQLKRYADMPDALADAENPEVVSWRSHYHVPLFIENYGVLQSTQQDIREVLIIHQSEPFTSHLEVETYTWEVLPDEMKLPISDSIIREMTWVVRLLNDE